tara:strand:- start:795 stop:1493 length:699 start_codon:yes stop_codon:yes gene_type:complete
MVLFSSEKDKIKRAYNIYKKDRFHKTKWSPNNLGNLIIKEERLIELRRLFVHNDILLKNKCILDVGCAGGNTISLMIELGASEKNIYGIDIREERLDYAKNKFPLADISLMDAGNIEYQDASFDVINVFTLFTSILDNDYRLKISEELYRVLKPEGYIIYYDFRFNNPFNKNVKGIKIHEIERLFPHMDKQISLITLLPPLARKLKKSTIRLYPIISTLNILKTHYLGLFKK